MKSKSKPLCEIKEWQLRENDEYRLLDLEWFESIEMKRKECEEFYKSRYKNSENKNKDKYIEYITDLDIARAYLHFKEGQMHPNEDNWHKNVEVISEIRYALGRIITYFERRSFHKKT